MTYLPISIESTTNGDNFRKIPLLTTNYLRLISHSRFSFNDSGAVVAGNNCRQPGSSVDIVDYAVGSASKATTRLRQSLIQLTIPLPGLFRLFREIHLIKTVTFSLKTNNSYAVTAVSALMFRPGQFPIQLLLRIKP